MSAKNKLIRVSMGLLSALLVFACFDLGTPTATKPQTLPPETTISLTHPTSPSDTLVPTITPTLTRIPSPTNTSLPPLPDFGQILAFGAGGGGGGPCMAPVFPPPVVYAQHSPYGAHVADLCVYQIALPVNTPIHLTLTSPDGTVALQGDFQSADATSVYWLGFENAKSNYAYYTENCKEASCANWGLEFWWPANLPGDTWQMQLSWNGGEVFGSFETNTDPPLPELSVQDALVFSTLRPAAALETCHPVASSVGLAVAGRGFPANAVVYVPVFEQVEGTQYRFLNAQIFVADGDGVVYGALTGPFQPGKKYALAGLTDATLPLIAPDQFGVVSFGNLDDAADCFLVP